MFLEVAFESVAFTYSNEIFLAEGVREDVENVLRMIGHKVVLCIEVFFEFLAEEVHFRPQVSFQRPFHVVLDVLRPFLTSHDVENHPLPVGNSHGTRGECLDGLAV